MSPIQTRIVSSWIKVLDESMSAFKPRTTKTGGLPNISFIARKPEPLGTEFKTVCCALSGLMLHMEIQRGKAGMKDAKYNRSHGATAGCTRRLTESTNQDEYSSADIIQGDTWFGSVTAATELAFEERQFCLQVKANSGLFPKK